MRRLRDVKWIRFVCGYLSIAVLLSLSSSFDVQRNKHSFVADRSDTNVIDDATIQTIGSFIVTMPCPLNACVIFIVRPSLA